MLIEAFSEVLVAAKDRSPLNYTIPREDFSRVALETHFAALQHLEYQYPKLMVFFSGTPGMGKTTLSKFLEETYKGIRLSDDEARHHLRTALKKNDACDAEIKLKEHIHKLLLLLDSITDNHLIIMDALIDGEELKALSLARSLGYETFVIRLKAPREVVIERLIKREQDPSVHLKRLDKWWEAYLSFDLSNVDFFFDVSKDFDALDLPSLSQAIHEKVRSILFLK